MSLEHAFTEQIQVILADEFGEISREIYERSLLIQYLNLKTRSAHRGSKSRASFANIYAIYVLVEDYIQQGFAESGLYSEYAGAQYTILFQRLRALPFGSKLQNHALNHRMNEEFRKYFPTVEMIPILRDTTGRYWFNERLLLVEIGGKTHNIARAILKIIERYIETKRVAFEEFITLAQKLSHFQADQEAEIENFVINLLAPHVDARIFEIVSYAILKHYYREQVVYFGFTLEEIKPEILRLYKTGRTNANDGGIDFVMRPLGRFFQVTETTDVKKYFLDIDKIERYPISFVIKSTEPLERLEQLLREGATVQYGITAIIEKYMSAIEEIINIPPRANFAIAAGGGLWAQS